jgi:hypothetical protein
MTEGNKHPDATPAEIHNRQWSWLLAQAVALSRDYPHPEYGNRQVQTELMRAETIELPFMLYTALLEILRQTSLLIPAMSAAGAGDSTRVEVAQGHLVKLDTIINVLKGLPAMDPNAQADVSEQVAGAVARLNGRWPG